MNDRTMRSSGLPGEHFPEDFPRRVLAQVRRERSQRRSRLAAATGAMLLLALLPITRLLRPITPAPSSSSSDLAWHDYAAQVTQLADASAPDEVSDYLAPEAARVSDWAASYSDASWQADADWESE